VTTSNPSRELSAIRDIEGEHFKFLIAVVYNKDFDVIWRSRFPDPWSWRNRVT